MGMWDFVTDAGKKLFGKDDEPEKTEAAITKEMKDLGLDAQDVDVKVDGDTVKIKGKTASQEMREKIILATGNILGVSKVEEDLEVSDDSKEAEFYTVEKGDTLSGIAKKTMGNANKYMAIFEANKPMLSDPDKIYPGQKLRIPAEA